MNKRLKNINVLFAYHNELKNFIIIIEKLIKHCKNLNNAYNKMYKIYFDS